MSQINIKTPTLRIVWALLVGGLIVLAFVMERDTRALVADIWEDTMFAIDPSAERAARYGEKHFDARHPHDYDIARASYFYERAHDIDPAFPFVQHQRARIAFLAGDFDRALELADLAIEGEPDPSSYYIRALIKGFMGDYAAAATDYETFLRTNPSSWAAINDYAWVLLKDNRPLDALVALDWGLMQHPDNPWLLNSKATAHFELHQFDLAKEAVVRASDTVMRVTEEEWLRAYPGNDPLIAREGLTAFQRAVRENMHTIALASAEEEFNMR